MSRWQRRKIAVTGYGGQLGTELCRQLGPRAIPLSEADLDLTDPAAVRNCLTRLEPAALINAAAYTQVDRAEAEPEACFRVNAGAVKTLARVCRDLDCPLMQVSTDYAFGADRDRCVPYTESDQPAPVNVYGESKLAGEVAARAWHKHFVVRTCGLYCVSPSGPVRGRNFVDTMLALSADRSELRIVSDQRCTPSYVPHVASAMIRLLPTQRYGTFHVTNGGSATWLDFAAELFRQAGIPMSLVPISTAEYGAAAPRAHFSVLDTSKFSALGVGDVPTWQNGIRDYLNLLATGMTSEIARKAA
jgi:dTDP-4-dehydrorhamnose reductase